MKFSERLNQLNRAQNTRLFKVIASCVVMALAVGGYVAYVVAAHAPADAAMGTAAARAATGDAAKPDSAKPAAPNSANAKGPTGQSAIDETRQVLESVIAVRSDSTSVAVGIGVTATVLLAVIWLGLGLTAAALMIAAGAVVYPLSLIPSARGAARLLAGVLALAGSFTVLMRVLQVAYSGPGPVWAVARNMLTEAVRMKVSVIFIVLLIFGLAYLPSTLDPTEQLRYRVQSFFQYATGGSFWIIALLTLAFSASSVAFEQRDKTIWQTMTKPVASWQYVLGKWLGAVGLNAVLLAVCASGIFLFTEYLRGQTARGESQPYVAASGSGVTEDRLILESRILRANVVVQCEPPRLVEEEFEKNLTARVEREKQSNPSFDTSPDRIAKIRQELYKAVTQAYRSLEPGRSEWYVFKGLGEARRGGLPLTFRYRIDSGSNMPDRVYPMTFQFGSSEPLVNGTGLGYFHTLNLLPSAVNDEGELEVQVMNGDLFTGQTNPETCTFPPGGLEISYASGSYRPNFLRVVFVLWVKLAFLAMLAVWASTFLSFPVACLVAFGAFFCAESAGYLAEAVENYASVDDKGNVIWFKVVINAVSLAVAKSFQVYADLKPTARLVDGQVLPWSSVALGTGVLGATTAALYGMAVAIFRRRELATYSGQ